MKRFFFETYGCQMNKAESAALERTLLERGWTAAGNQDEADLVIINTCSVRITAENRAWGRIAHYAARKKTRPFRLVVTGCMAERLKARMMEEQPAIDCVLGLRQKNAFGLMLDAVERGGEIGVLEESPSFAFATDHWESGAFRSYVPVMHGCDNFCSYCIVPYLRGREVSRDPEAILSELRELESRGVREVTLLGQNVNSYRSPDGSLDFAGLLQVIAREFSARGGIRWIRFMTSHPKDLPDRLIETIARERILCRHVHLCVQHGSDRVLQAMNRKYDVARFRELATRLRAAVPGVSLSTDILVGFPGETEEDLEATLALMRELRFEFAYMYYFNRREGTAAASMPGQLSEKVKKDRLARVIELQRSIGAEILRSRVGQTVDVLVEDVSRRRKDELLGRTEREEMVVFKGDPSLLGSFATVRLESLAGSTFRGRLVESGSA